MAQWFSCFQIIWVSRVRIWVKIYFMPLPQPCIQDEYPLRSIQNKQFSIAQWFSACLVISGSRVRIWLLIFDLRQHSEHLSKSLLSPGIKPGTHRVQDRFHGPTHSRPQCGKTNLLPRAVNFSCALSSAPPAVNLKTKTYEK